MLDHEPCRACRSYSLDHWYYDAAGAGCGWQRGTNALRLTRQPDSPTLGVGGCTIPGAHLLHSLIAAPWWVVCTLVLSSAINAQVS